MANRVQNTLGNYDEMKELLTSHSNQSHLVGIPKSCVPQTPMEKAEQPGFFPEGARGRPVPGQAASGSMPPPGPSSASSTSSSSSTPKKSRATDWHRGGGQASLGAGSTCGRGKHGAAIHEPPPARHEDPFVLQGDSHKGDSSPATSSSHGRRHASAKGPPVDTPYKEPPHSRSPGDVEVGPHGVGSPVASTSLLPGGLATPTFPQALHSKPSMVQQKPTAYVRPMDGQDQLPIDSPELKPPMEIGDGYGNATFGGLVDGKAGSNGTKGKLPKLTLPPPGEVGVLL